MNKSKEKGVSGGVDREHTRRREQLGQRPWCENEHRMSSHYKRTSVAGIMWEKKRVIQEDVEVRWIIRREIFLVFHFPKSLYLAFFPPCPWSGRAFVKSLDVIPRAMGSFDGGFWSRSEMIWSLILKDHSGECVARVHLRKLVSKLVTVWRRKEWLIPSNST